MVKETNAEQDMAGEASSSSRKRQRLPSVVEEEEGENGGRTASENRNVDGGEVITEVRSGTMFGLDLLECPVCCNALSLSAPIYQCDNGHIACTCCCIKLSNKCPACTLPIGHHHRCIVMERVVEAIIFPCPNAKHGCTEKFSYGKELVHKKKCGFALCYCPKPNCNYSGVYKDLYSHYDANHKDTSDSFRDVWIVLEECRDGNRNLDSDEVITEVRSRSGTMFDLDLLDCPVCCKALTTPIYQCDNGHIACSSCCVNLRHKCPECTLPIGNYRCRIMERVVKAIIVPCPNANHGCPEKFSYGKELLLEKQCGFALCYCPKPDCNYAGVYKDLYCHYLDSHENGSWFMFGRTTDAWMFIRDKIFFLRGNCDGPLVVIQCFEEPKGIYVTVKCIAPPAPEVEEISFQLFYSSYHGEKTMSFGLAKMKRIQKVSYQTPEEDYMLIPDYFLAQRPDLKMKICINRVVKEEEKEKAKVGVTAVVDNQSRRSTLEGKLTPSIKIAK
ncbi:unnamed protein product [Microthlaspi erraticum]|uniref:RING-type E3 ubiquitin transferase n=1 Tax=Microthlaspi erraticum TaxID=1685480 RepID=A0A6D2HTH9_9BRAS|nr:unnamed protein product [Microthlaspi erraticum]